MRGGRRNVRWGVRGSCAVGMGIGFGRGAAGKRGSFAFGGGSVFAVGDDWVVENHSLAAARAEN